ncbi:hypothetical protein FPOAC2_08678 [Fusarium poae]|uniref:Uncharacterized protein n=1 Tax=Fusarium poae TaxID=36050 RepID=A0A1B8ALX1_FUSPO|nr:hypothetical protein FPOAC1_008747 [Fusarium poae]KAG8669354.1 hypothetical protein FPOAC1_008747 [Fusarium poae]OBS21580.1 hypothetical protein FPOA_07916 [Fusarium poae]
MTELGTRKKDKEKDPTRKDKKGKAKAQTDFIDLSCSPTSKSSKAQSGPPPNAPGGPSLLSANTPSGDHSKAWRKTFTHNPQALPMFSSNNPIDPPRAGANASPESLYSRSSGDTERTSHEVKIKILEMCISLKNKYLDIPPAAQADQEPFWGRVMEMLNLMPLTKGKYKESKDVHRAVEYWCQPRRSYMRENRLPAVSQSQPELDTLIDQWNLVFAQRFCKIHSGYFANTQFAQDTMKQIVKDEVDSWITRSLKERRNELERTSQPTLLSADSSLKDYGNAVKGLQNKFEMIKRDKSQALESEAVMSIVLKLQPSLRTAISQFLNGPTEPTRRTEPAIGTLEHVGFTPCSNGASVPATTVQRLEKPESQRREDDPLRKRKHLETESSGLKGGNTANTVPYDQSKRPRLDNHHNLPPVADTTRQKDTRVARSPPFRRPPLPSQSPTWKRNGPPDYRNDGYRSSGGHPPHRYEDHYRGDRNQDYYRGRYQDGDRYRPPPRAIRETTADFEGMSIQQQNMSLLRQIKQVKDMVEKKN